MHILHKPGRYILSQNHMTIKRRAPVTYKDCAPSLIMKGKVLRPLKAKGYVEGSEKKQSMDKSNKRD